MNEYYTLFEDFFDSFTARSGWNDLIEPHVLSLLKLGFSINVFPGVAHSFFQGEVPITHWQAELLLPYLTANHGTAMRLTKASKGFSLPLLQPKNVLNRAGPEEDPFYLKAGLTQFLVNGLGNKIASGFTNSWVSAISGLHGALRKESDIDKIKSLATFGIMPDEIKNILTPQSYLDGTQVESVKRLINYYQHFANYLTSSLK